MHHRQHHHCYEGRGRHGFGRGRFFSRFGTGFVGGPGMRMAKMLASGDLQLIILALLSEKPRYGYEIIKQIEEHSSGMYSPVDSGVPSKFGQLETGLSIRECILPNVDSIWILSSSRWLGVILLV